MIPVILNKDNLDYMKRVVDTCTVPQAIIIDGAEGSGKYTLAQHFAAMINCEGEGEKPCGVCGACKKIFGGVHADVTVVDLQDDKKSISVDQVRDIISSAYLVPSEAKKRIYIIRNAQALTAQAQNALLKIFEEPPKDVIFLMLTTDKRLLLSTILSRGVSLKTQLLPDHIIKEKLLSMTKKSEAETDAICSVAQGSLGKAIELAGGTKILKLRSVVENYFTLLTKPAPVYALCEALPPHGYKREELTVIFEFFRLAFRDIAASKTQDTQPIFFTDTQTMVDAAKAISVENAVLLYEKADKICNCLSFNVNSYTTVSLFNAYVAQHARLG